jgi:hypothetical protein
MGVFILTEVSVGGSDPRIGDKAELMGHVPCVSMNNNGQWLRQHRPRLGQRIGGSTIV